MAKRRQVKNNQGQKSRIDHDVRADSYQEIFMNVGGPGDPSSYSGTGIATLLTRWELDNIFMGDGVGRRIVEVVPEEMFRKGFTIDGVENTDDLFSRWDAMDINNKLIDAFVWTRLYGGSLVVMGLADGSSSMMNPAGDGELAFIRVYDKNHVRPFQKYSNPNHEKYGEPEIYMITPPGSGAGYKVHESRCIRIDGDRVPERFRQANDGWGGSCLQGVTDALKDFGISHRMASSLLARKQQGVWKVKELAEMIKDKYGKALIRERLDQVDMTRSINNSIGLDAVSEEYELLNGDLTGVTDVIDSKKSVIMMVTGIHESILTGENVSGINANENTALESFHKLVEREQMDNARPVIEALVSRMIKDQTWKIKFNPLAIESEAQKSDRMQKQSQADSAYVQEQILSPEEIRDTLAKRGDYVMSKAPVVIPPGGDKTVEEDEKIINGD